MTTRRRRVPPKHDGTGWLPPLVAGVGLLLAAYLLLALGVPEDVPAIHGDDCYDRVVYHAARLTDC